MSRCRPEVKKLAFQFHFLLISFLLCINNISAERVGKILYKGFLEDFNGTTMTVPYDMVALSEIVYMPKDSSNMFLNSSSIYFVIDHSGSMFNWDNNGSQIDYPSDSMGHRFTVTQAIIDTLINNPERFPEVECGLAVFANDLYYKISADNVFKPVIDNWPGYRGGHIPLLEIAKEYPEYNNRTGGEILKEKLETVIKNGVWQIDFNNDDIIDTIIRARYRDLTAEKEIWAGTGTDIHVGFRAAVDALKEANNPRRSQYIIFISDGENSNPFDNDFEQGILVKDTGEFPNNKEVYDTIPTTFTVFFTASGQAPQQMQNMNENIKNNAFSSSNLKYTMLWPFENSTQDSLMKFLLQNVVSIFQGQEVVLPIDITIQGLNIVAQWDGNENKFIFPSVIPLEDWETDFSYDLKYSLVYDTIDENGDTVQVVKDTSFLMDFTVEIDPNMDAPPDTFQVSYWDRYLGFYYNDTQIDSVDDEGMEKVEIRFSYTPGDAQYTYSNVEVEITNATGNNIDKETFQLEKQGSDNIFSFEFSRVVDPNNISPGDGVLQHYCSDTLIAVFRNKEEPRLPLDTLHITIPVDLTNTVKVSKGIYFDNNAEGFVDSIFIGISGVAIGENIDALMNEVELPEHREFRIIEYKTVNSGVAVIVEENTQIPQTYVTDKDIIVVKNEVILPYNGVILAPSEVSIIDSIAPIIMQASLIDSIIYTKKGTQVTLCDTVKDELTVVFSETVEEITKDRPFKFFSINNQIKYEGEISVLNQYNDVCIFLVESLEGVESIQNGDSIRINWTLEDNVFDTVGNNQDNPDNIRREINVKLFIDTVQVPAPFDLVLKATLLTPKGYKIPATSSILEIQGIADILDEVDKSKNDTYQGIMIITLEPEPLENVSDLDSYTAVLNIFDAVGNEIVRDRDMYYDKQLLRLIYIWDGRNSNGRKVGAGSYLAVVPIDFYFDKKKIRSDGKRLILGVKE